MLERQARDLEVRGSNPGPVLIFYLEITFKLYIYIYIYLKLNSMAYGTRRFNAAFTRALQ